ncbi:uncharacterized protein LOC130850514 [Hippopotamus amphibius kiboko]|uniref:uncharacterized protein LOC130850514 n=1 Tax=Hippopotamus amphibius kiboko TaxID=575201 RepID=UPI00259518A1|nr:uncharacterized protein LOC130850514 [Hippopotamus amphibius kiboko]
MRAPGGGRSGHRQGQGAGAGWRAGGTGLRARGQGGPLRAVTEQGSVPPRLDRRRGHVSSGADVPASHGGRAPGCAQRDRTRSGVTARTDRLSGLPEHARLAPRGSWNPQQLRSFTFLKEQIRHWCSLDPQNPQEDKKWCYPAHAWASEPGLLQVFLALTREYAAFWNHDSP